MKTGIVWFRNDLRMSDNESLWLAAQECDTLIPLYCFDLQTRGISEYGFKKMGDRRLQFLLESLDVLHKMLLNFGSGLKVELGDPIDLISRISGELDAYAVYAQGGATPEERTVEIELNAALAGHTALKLSYGATLFHPDDLPFDIQVLPDVFSEFRKQLEHKSEVRARLKIEDLPPLPSDFGSAVGPSAIHIHLASNVADVAGDARAAIYFHGGEQAALARLNHYFWETKSLAKYKETRNGLIGADYSSKFSAWLANGSISPRTIYDEVLRFEREVNKNSSTYWLIFELLWRDYFHFVAKKYGSKLFYPGGIRGIKPRTIPDRSKLDAWVQGRTGIPFVDANMRELALTGFMSNRGRQNVASFLVKDLYQDWRLGAAYFEQELVDYDPASNWGNWAYVAGVGNDPREERYFNIMIQAERYDPDGDYVRLWLPELADVPSSFVHKPWVQSAESLRGQGLAGTVYAHPVMVPERWRL